MPIIISINWSIIPVATPKQFTVLQINYPELEIASEIPQNLSKLLKPEVLVLHDNATPHAYFN